MYAFAQVARSGTRKGAGLGLAITWQYVELMRAGIRLVSTKGHGSRFRVELDGPEAAAWRLRERI